MFTPAQILSGRSSKSVGDDALRTVLGQGSPSAPVLWKISELAIRAAAAADPQGALGALNALNAIRDRTRLIIGDALNICTQNWNSAVNGDTILMSFDPVAHDATGLQLFAAAREAAGGNANTAQHKVTAWLEYAASLGLGEHRPETIDKVEVNLA